MSEHNITVEGATYRVFVDGDGPTLLLLHGFTGSASNWEPLVSRFAASYTVVRVDLLGHGTTTAPDDPNRYAMPHAARDLVALMHDLGHSAFHLLGYSMGGRLALYTAVHYPEAVQTLTLESASPGLTNEDERTARIKRDEALGARIENEGVPAFVDFWEKIVLFDSQANASASDRQRLRDQRLTNHPTGLANSLRGMGTGVQPSQWENLSALDMPVLLVTGMLDTKFMDIATDMAQDIQKAQRVTIAYAGHTVHFEQPIAYQSVVLGFLDANR
jgi:2-succinyl-6-hydroxy-2,4-cyclohexadiene-1-carboxylate synthase